MYFKPNIFLSMILTSKPKQANVKWSRGDLAGLQACVPIKVSFHLQPTKWAFNLAPHRPLIMTTPRPKLYKLDSLFGNN